MSNTRRVNGSASGGKTSRVAGAVSADNTRRVSGAISATATTRVTSAPSGGKTERVEFDHYLLLEGDESGHLLLEGSSDALGIEGDEARAAGIYTRRVAQ